MFLLRLEDRTGRQFRQRIGDGLSFDGEGTGASASDFIEMLAKMGEKELDARYNSQKQEEDEALIRCSSSEAGFATASNADFASFSSFLSIYY